MHPLKLSHESVSVHVQTNKFNDHRSDNHDDWMMDQFPKPRYFQVHFQYLHETNHQLQDELAQLKGTVAQLNDKISCLLALLNRQSDPIP